MLIFKQSIFIQPKLYLLPLGKTYEERRIYYIKNNKCKVIDELFTKIQIKLYYLIFHHDNRN